MLDATTGFHPENVPTKRDGGRKAPERTGSTFSRDPWEKKLGKEWKDRIDASTTEDVRAESSKVSFAEVANQQLKADDLDLAAARAAAADAAKQYVDATKANKAKLAYMRFLLECRGQEPAAKDMGLQSAT